MGCAISSCSDSSRASMIMESRSIVLIDPFFLFCMASTHYTIYAGRWDADAFDVAGLGHSPWTVGTSHIMPYSANHSQAVLSAFSVAQVATAHRLASPPEAAAAAESDRPSLCPSPADPRRSRFLGAIRAATRKIATPPLFPNAGKYGRIFFTYCETVEYRSACLCMRNNNGLECNL